MASQARWKNQADNKRLHFIIYQSSCGHSPSSPSRIRFHHQDSGLDQLAHHIIMQGLVSKVLLCI
ncbi:MAG: hypothetical protein GKC09_08745 [Methanosarcinales archaeon]|nr:hypothetical protein [Methanosarcinales archaeon]